MSSQSDRSAGDDDLDEAQVDAIIHRWRLEANGVEGNQEWWAARFWEDLARDAARERRRGQGEGQAN